jgi:hypothetical protein
MVHKLARAVLFFVNFLSNSLVVKFSYFKMNKWMYHDLNSNYTYYI